MLQVPGQRVLFLKFAAEKDRNMFFWLQEPEEAGDERLREAADKAINTMPGEAVGWGWWGRWMDGAAGCRLPVQWRSHHALQLAPISISIIIT